MCTGLAIRGHTIPKSGEKKSLMPFFLVGCGSGSRGCKTARIRVVRLHAIDCKWSGLVEWSYHPPRPNRKDHGNWPFNATIPSNQRAIDMCYVNCQDNHNRSTDQFVVGYLAWFVLAALQKSRYRKSIELR